MAKPIEKVLLDLGEDFLGQLDIETHHLLHLLAPLVDHLIDDEGSVEHGRVLDGEDRIRSVSHPF